MRKRELIATAGFLLIVAALFGALTYRSRKQTRAIETWPVISATVQEARLESTRVTGGGRRRRGSIEYTYVLKLTTVHNGKTYSHTKRLKDKRGPDGTPIGSTISVRFNPDDPAHIILEQEFALIRLIQI